MSASLVVNTADGSCWVRRALLRDGSGLYALAGSVAGCPDDVLVSLTELAVHGIAGSADVLPVPVGPEPQALSLSEAQIEALAAAGNRVVNDAVHEDLCMCDAWPEKCLSSGNLRMGDWDMSGLEGALPAVLALWEQMRGGEIARLRSQVEALLTERHSTNESLDEAVQALRAAPAAMVCRECEAPVRWVDPPQLSNGGWWNHVSPTDDGHGIVPKPAPSQALREDEPAKAPDFFQPGRTYLRFVGDRELYFRVTSISTDNPNRSDSVAGDGPVAYGWSRTERSTTVWGPTGQTSFVGWHDVTEAGGR